MTVDMDLETLLQHRGFLKALARGLVADPLEQDELLWETMGKGAMCPPRHAALKPWLARVMRNRAKSRERARLRRLAHEQVGAQVDEAESASDVAARFELVHQLALHVRALPPGYRDVVLLRFFDDIPPREIAQRLAVPIETVKTRLRRALALLRARLDREHGSREKWLGSLVPLAFPGAKAATIGITTLGGAMMAMKTKVALVGIGLLLLLGARMILVETTEEQSEEPGIQGELASEQNPDSPRKPVSVPTAPDPVHRTQIAVKPPTYGSVRVSVRDAADLPVPNSIVSLIEWDQQLGRVKKLRYERSDAFGVAEFRKIKPCMAIARLFCTFGNPGKETAHKGQVEAGEVLALRVVAGSTRLVEGRVVDEEGGPAPGSLIRVRWVHSPSAFQAMAETDDDGRFSFSAPESEDLRMQAVRGDHETSLLRAIYTTEKVEPLLFRLRSPVVRKTLRVKTNLGLPVRGAKVIVGHPWPGFKAHRSYEEARAGSRRTICSEPPHAYVTDANGVTRVNLWGDQKEAARDYVYVEAKGMASIAKYMFFGKKGQEGEKEEMEIIMVPQPVVYGQIIDPLATATSGRRAVVYVTLKSQSRSWVARADKNGRYKLEGLPVGVVELRALSKERGGPAQHRRMSRFKMTLKAGESYLWNPVLRRKDDDASCAYLLGQSGLPLTGYYATDLSESGAVVESARRRKSKKWGRISLPGRNRGIAIYRQGEMLPRRVIQAADLRLLVGQAIKVPDGRSGSISFSVEAPADIRVRVNMVQQLSGISLGLGLRDGKLRPQGLSPGVYEFTIVFSWGSGSSRQERTYRSRIKLDGVQTDLHHPDLSLQRDMNGKLSLTPEAGKVWAIL